MTDLRDIEKAEKSKEGAITVYGRDSQPPIASDGSSISPSTRTTKSGSVSVQMSIDPSVLKLVSGMDDDSDYEDEKPVLFCGSCCDLLRACIIVDVCYILQKLQIGLVVFMGWGAMEDDTNQIGNDDYYTDDYYTEGIEVESSQGQFLLVLLADYVVSILLTKNALGVVFGLISIYGAYRFNQYLVLTTAIWLCIEIIWGVSFERYISSICAIYFTYPHFALFLALRKGRITRENYQDVKSCCWKPRE